MTGEITLRGRVLPIGGVKDRVLAEQRVGVHAVILLEDNEPDMRDVPLSAREQLHLLFVEHMDEVLPTALHPETRAEKEHAYA